MKIIFSGGGTGGHIYPAIALIKAINNKNENHEILYIGNNNSLESKICEKEGIKFKDIKVRYFYRKLTLKNILTAIEFYKAYKKSIKIIKQFKPDVIIGTGGYVCAPVVYAGYKKKVKTVIHEQNSVPGLTNKFLSKYTTKVAICFESSKKFFNENKVDLIGNPRAQEVYETKLVNKTELGFSENKKLIVFFAGSQGAKYVNDAIIKSLPTLSKNKNTEVLFITGPKHYEKIVEETKHLHLNSNIIIRAYVDNMPQIYKLADLVVCRAGATSLAEITAIGIPAILIPSPFVTNNHQEKNALDLVNKEAAIMIKEKELSDIILLKEINDLINDPYKLQKMRINSRKLGIPKASDNFIDLIKRI